MIQVTFKILILILLVDLKKFIIPQEESKVEQYSVQKEILKSEKRAEKRETSNKQSFIEIKLNLFDFKEKAEMKIKKTEANPIAINFNDNKAEKTKENINIINTQNTTDINSKNDSCYSKKEDDRTDNSNNLSLLDKLLRNNIIQPKKNLEKVNLSANEKNKTSDNISSKFVNTNQSDDSSFIINKKICNNNNKEKNFITKNKSENNFAIQTILNFGKTNNISFEKSKFLFNRLKENIKKKDIIDNIPLWIENEKNDLDFSVNTVCYDRKDNKLNSMPNNFQVDPYVITEIKTDNSKKVEINIKNTNSIGSKLDNSSCGTKNSKDNFRFNINKSQNFNNRPESGVLSENDENNKQFLSSYENFNNNYTDSNDSLISNYSKISSEKLNDIHIISGDNYEYDSGEETVFIRREDSNNKKEEKNEILIVIKKIFYSHLLQSLREEKGCRTCQVNRF